MECTIHYFTPWSRCPSAERGLAVEATSYTYLGIQYGSAAIRTFVVVNHFIGTIQNYPVFRISRNYLTRLGNDRINSTCCAQFASISHSAYSHPACNQQVILDQQVVDSINYILWHGLSGTLTCMLYSKMCTYIQFHLSIHCLMHNETHTMPDAQWHALNHHVISSTQESHHTHNQLAISVEDNESFMAKCKILIEILHQSSEDYTIIIMPL